MRSLALRDVCNLITDGTHYTPPDIGNGVPFLTVKDIDDQGSLDFDGCSKIAEDEYVRAAAGNSAPIVGDVLFSKDGTVGKVSVVREHKNFAVLSSIAILRPNADVVDSNYLAHSLKSPAVLDQAIKKKTGSAIRRIILSDLKGVRLPVPSLPDQRRIAAILDKTDLLRAKRREVIAKLDQLLQSVFLNTFGDPVTNSKGWPTATVGELATFITSGSRGWAKYYADAGAKFIRIQNLVNGELEIHDCAYVVAPDSAEARRTLVRDGDVLVSITADLGRTAVVPKGLGAAHINQHIAILRMQGIDSAYVSHFLAGPGGQIQFKRLNRSAVKAGLNFDDIRSLEILVPPEEIQRSYLSMLNAIRQLGRRCEIELVKLDQMFASTQQRAFSGTL